MPLMHVDRYDRAARLVAELIEPGWERLSGTINICVHHEAPSSALAIVRNPERSGCANAPFDRRPAHDHENEESCEVRQHIQKMLIDDRFAAAAHPEPHRVDC